MRRSSDGRQEPTFPRPISSNFYNVEFLQHRVFFWLGVFSPGDSATSNFFNVRISPTLIFPLTWSFSPEDSATSNFRDGRCLQCRAAIATLFLSFTPCCPMTKLVALVALLSIIKCSREVEIILGLFWDSFESFLGVFWEFFGASPKSQTNPRNSQVHQLLHYY